MYSKLNDYYIREFTLVHRHRQTQTREKDSHTTPSFPSPTISWCVSQMESCKHILGNRRVLVFFSATRELVEN